MGVMPLLSTIEQSFVMLQMIIRLFNANSSEEEIYDDISTNSITPKVNLHHTSTKYPYNIYSKCVYFWKFIKLLQPLFSTYRDITIHSSFRIFNFFHYFSQNQVFNRPEISEAVGG